MELENRTKIPALLMRGCIDRERLAAAVVARVTYELDGRGGLRPAAEQAWKVSTAPWECDYGPMDSDEVFYRGGVDLMIFGSARAPQGRPVQQLEIRVRVGEEFERRVLVHGPRRWERGGGGLVPGRPEAFTELPLTLEHAYGGKDVWDELPIPYPMNPDGKGYYISEESALGQPLPQIEDPEQLVQRWDDHPEPMALGAPGMTFGPRVQRAVVFDEETHVMRELRPLFYNAADHRLVVPSAAPGDIVEIHGVSEAGPVVFALPPTQLRVRVRVGKHAAENIPAIDQIGIEPDLGRVFITYRYPFRYRLVPLEERSCELFGRRTAPQVPAPVAGEAV